MFGLKTKDVLQIMETWYAEKRAEIKSEVVKQVMDDVTIFLQDTVDDIVLKMKEVNDLIERSAEAIRKAEKAQAEVQDSIQQLAPSPTPAKKKRTAKKAVKKKTEA